MDIEDVRKALRLVGLDCEIRPGFYTDDVPSAVCGGGTDNWSVGPREDEFPVWRHGPCIVVIPVGTRDDSLGLDGT